MGLIIGLEGHVFLFFRVREEGHRSLPWLVVLSALFQGLGIAQQIFEIHLCVEVVPHPGTRRCPTKWIRIGV